MPKSIRTLFTCLLLFTATAPAWAAVTTLVIFPVIRPVSQVAFEGGSVIELGKVVRIIAPRDEQKMLSKLELPVGDLFSRQKIAKADLVALLRTLPELAPLEIVGPEWVNVVAPTDPVASNKVLKDAAEALREHIASHWHDRYRNIELSYRGERSRLPVGPESKWAFDFSNLDHLKRRTPVWLVASHGSDTERAILWFKISGEELVWQSLGGLEAKSVADEYQFVQRWVSLEDIKPSELAVPSAKERVTVAMQAGDVLTSRHLEPIPDVEFGQDALVISKVGDVEIRSIATVMRTAFVGETIELQSKSSNESFEAQVLDRNLVQINSAQAMRK
jgi:hypothetical protein